MPCNSSNPDFHQKSFRIKHDDDKFLTKLLSKESSRSNPSFRVYYGTNVPSAVPFTWETRPGTPKHAFANNSSVPPLTPPPSYFATGSKSYSNKETRANFLHTLLRRIHSKKVFASSSPSSVGSTLSWSTSCSSSFSDPSVTPHRRIRRQFSSWGSSSTFDEKGLNDELCGSSRMMCFGMGSKSSNGAGEKRIHGRRINWQVKNALLSIVGRWTIHTCHSILISCDRPYLDRSQN